METHSFCRQLIVCPLFPIFRVHHGGLAAKKPRLRYCKCVICVSIPVSVSIEKDADLFRMLASNVVIAARPSIVSNPHEIKFTASTVEYQYQSFEAV